MDEIQKLYTDIFNTYSPETVLIYLLRQVSILTKNSEEKDPEFVIMSNHINSLIDIYLNNLNINKSNVRNKPTL